MANHWDVLREGSLTAALGGKQNAHDWIIRWLDGDHSDELAAECRLFNAVQPGLVRPLREADVEWQLSENGGRLVLNAFHFGGFFGSDGSNCLRETRGTRSYTAVLVQGKCPRLLQAYHQLLGFGRLGQSGIRFEAKANLSRLAALVSGGHVELAGGALECLSAGRNETQHTVDEGRDWRHWATPANLQQQQDQHLEWRLFGAVAPELDH
jgi:hypothetical protein